MFRFALVVVVAANLLLLGASGCGEDEHATCGRATCNGCCSLGACLEGTTVQACGSEGYLCMACGSGESCVSGQCVKSCSAQTCPSGCCQQGQCISATSAAACGFGGGTCVACPSGQICQNGACIFGTPCTSATCPSGCCQNNQCLPGNTVQACGLPGGSCATCQAGQSCVGGVCGGRTCGPDNCSGCCSVTNQCLAGNIQSACGSGGLACSDCSAYGSCSAGGCTVNPQSIWTVQVGRVQVDPNEEYDEDALPGYKAPDLYVVLSAGGQSNQTGVMNETFSATFNQDLLEVQAQALNQALLIKVMDQDLVPPDQEIGQCTLSIPYHEIAAGLSTVNNCGGSKAQLVTIQYQAR